MAISENRNFNRPPDSIDETAVDQPVVRSSTRWRWSIWPVVTVLALWWLGWGWGGTGGWLWGPQASNSAAPGPAAYQTSETAAETGVKQSPSEPPGQTGRNMNGPGAQVLAARNKQAFIGKPVAANDVPVQQRVSSRAVWIGGDQPMLAVVSGTGSSTDQRVEDGKVIDVQGVVQQAPIKVEAKKSWAITDSDASRLEHEGAYIQVSQLSVPVR